MARTAREKSKTGIYHIVLRGVNKQTIFEDQEDSEKFLKTFEDYKKKSGYKIYAYCLMGNHVHLLIKEEQEELSTIMRRIGASYVYWYNWKYMRSGHLFQDRYKSEAIEDETYLLNVVRYIHQNPLKAGLVRDISKYKWSSYSEYIGRDKLIDRDFVLGLFDDDINRAISNFKGFHRTMSKDKYLDIKENKRLRDNEAIEIIKKTCNISHCTDLQNLDKDNRDEYLKIIKEKGLSTRQIARLTGISRGIVLKT